MGKLISSILSESWVRIPLQSDDHEGVIREIINPLKDHDHVQDFETLFDETWKREQKESTCIGNGIAFPHARCNAVDELVIAAGVHPGGISFAGMQSKIYIIFCIGTPLRMGTEYLAAVGALARVLKEESVRKQLLEAKHAEEFVKIIAEEES
ncbi:MAG: PTS sugar transporter subunit IIA [Verrucomicrobiota bacterium]